MRRSDFQYDLPPDLIAQYPAERRDASRLLCLDGTSGTLQDRQFSDLPTLLMPGDLLVLNDTQVIPARLYGEKDSGGKVEVLVERVLDAHQVLAHVRASKTPRIGRKLLFGSDYTAEVMERQGECFILQFSGHQDVMTILDAIGHMPLPPYIRRPDERVDQDRYQTVYAKQSGAVAAPTAGLHFDQAMLACLKEQGIEFATVTLHVGAGTFQPLRSEDLSEHKMHSERMILDQQVCDQVKATQAQGRRVIAVGTTSVRCLETAARSGKIEPYTGETDIFIAPGFEFKVTDAMLTNFHLPESTLLMLVSAFAGYEHIMAAYRHAVKMHYRFFSYGDAMFLTLK